MAFTDSHYTYMEVSHDPIFGESFIFSHFIDKVIESLHAPYCFFLHILVRWVLLLLVLKRENEIEIDEIMTNTTGFSAQAYKLSV